MNMDCPQCKHSGAYIGLQWVHCQNEKCRYYDARYTEKVREENKRLLGRAVDKLILLGGQVADSEE